MRVSYLQHVPFEGLAAIEPWLLSDGHSVTPCRLFEDAHLPGTSEFDWLIIMGGPMGANDDGIYDWLSAEKSLIKKAIGEGKTVLGICLGAQLIAAALGAPVYANEYREIGWFPITSTTTAGTHHVGRLMPESIDVFHWHGDTFDLPSGAQRLASSQACRNQAFCFGEKVLALQFHLEATSESAAQLVEHCRNELKSSGPYVQTAEQMLARRDRFDRANALLAEILSAFAAA